jgi:hypothetical protein
MILDEIADEVLLVPRDYGFNSSCHRSCHVHVVVGIGAINL